MRARELPRNITILRGDFMKAKNNKKSGVLYITEKNNIFIAPEGLSKKEYEKISKEIDAGNLKMKIEK